MEFSTCCKPRIYVILVYLEPSSIIVVETNKDVDDYKVTRHATTVNKVLSQLLKRGRLKQNSGRRRQRFKFVFPSKSSFPQSAFHIVIVMEYLQSVAISWRQERFCSKRQKHEFQPVLNISKTLFSLSSSPSPPSAPSSPVCLDHIPESSASFFVHSLAASSTFTHLIHRPMKTKT